MLYHSSTCALHVHKPTEQLVASGSLFLDIQVVTFLLGDCRLFARANLYYLTNRLRSHISTIFAAHLHVCTRAMGCKRSLKLLLIPSYVYTRLCMLQILLRNMYVVSVLEHQRADCDQQQAPKLVNMDVGEILQH